MKFLEHAPTLGCRSLLLQALTYVKRELPRIVGEKAVEAAGREEAELVFSEEVKRFNEKIEAFTSAKGFFGNNPANDQLHRLKENLVMLPESFRKDIVAPFEENSKKLKKLNELKKGQLSPQEMATLVEEWESILKEAKPVLESFRNLLEQIESDWKEVADFFCEGVSSLLEMNVAIDAKNISFFQWVAMKGAKHCIVLFLGSAGVFATVATVTGKLVEFRMQSRIIELEEENLELKKRIQEASSKKKVSEEEG